jgi:hypothetical protein
MINLKEESTQVVLLSAKRRGDDTTLAVSGTSVDLANQAGRVLVVVSVGATATATAVITIEESADDSTYATMTNGEIAISTTGASVVNLKPTKRYMRATVTLLQTADISSVYFDCSVVGIVYNERIKPSSVA